jgi:hypothetical protein
MVDRQQEITVPPAYHLFDIDMKGLDIYMEQGIFS